MPSISSGESESKGQELQTKKKWIFVTPGFIAIKAIHDHQTLKLMEIL